MTTGMNADGSMNLWPGRAPEPDGVRTERQPVLIPRLVKTEKPRGAVIVCPGGGYARLADHEGIPVAERFNQAGLHAFVLKYRCAPHRHPVPLMDAQRAIRLVRHHAAEWKVSPTHVAILGFSAGGHLTTTAMTHFDAGNAASPDPVERHSSRPDAGIPCYAVISFGPFGHKGSANNLLGPDAPQALRDSLSNETQVTPQTPPAFLWHTADDGGVPVENSLLFAQALSRCKVPFALHVFPHGRHGVGLGTELPDVAVWPELCAGWLKARGF